MKFVISVTLTAYFLYILPSIYGNYSQFGYEDKENERITLIIDIISMNLKNNGWNNILCVGHLPNIFYQKIQHIPFTFSVTNTENDDVYIEDTVPYHSNIIIANVLYFQQFQDTIMKIISLPYWHPHSNIILYYHVLDNDLDKAKLFFILWYYKACNAIIVQYNDFKDTLYISHYSPYVYEKYQYPKLFGCWTLMKIGYPVSEFGESFYCTENCHNITDVESRLRQNNLGTCIGLITNKVPYGDFEFLRKFNLFEDRAKNLNGFTLRAYTTEVLPFFEIREYDNKSYTLNARDGMIWNTMSKVMNFSIDLSPSMSVMKKSFNFEVNIEQIFSIALRKADLFLIPIYQIDLVIAEIDLTYPFKESGVCFLSHRAEFETILFDIKLLQKNYMLLILFSLCFVAIWLNFLAFAYVEKNKYSFDQLGKDLINTIRNILSISLHKPPKRESFRIFLTISLWCFFIINFSFQAAIISFFTAFKRGKEVNTFEDIIEKGYPIEGMASPDVFLPQTEERFQKINSKLVPIPGIFSCVDSIGNNSRKFCLIDCAVGRYLERNKLNENGEQYLHIAKDRIHSHYLNMIFPKYSPLTQQYNTYMQFLFEAGLIKKWEQYRYNDIKEEAPVKALGMVDLNGIFKGYWLLMGFSSLIFVFEIIFNMKKWVNGYLNQKLQLWKRNRIKKNRRKENK